MTNTTMMILSALAMLEGNPSGALMDHGTTGGRYGISKAVVTDYNRAEMTHYRLSDIVSNREIDDQVARWHVQRLRYRSWRELGLRWNKSADYAERFANLMEEKKR